MKIAYCSDTHIEFGYLDIENKEKADVLVLAGDICVIEDFYKSRGEEFFDKCADEFENVIYVLGNHEYYHGDIVDSFVKLKNLLSHRHNIHILDNEFVDIGDCRFIGTTMWTDMNGRNVHTEQVVRMRMNDFRLIKNSSFGEGYRLTPEHVEDIFDKSLDFISQSLRDDMINIVVTHHAPSQESIPEGFYYDYYMNGAYRTELRDYILNSNISMWFHGHTHHNVAYNIGNTVILSNQRGYIGHEGMANNFKLEYVEIETI